jgi:hypothetical protein
MKTKVAQAVPAVLNATAKRGALPTVLGYMKFRADSTQRKPA